MSDERTLIVVSARMRSERCPGKALAELAGKPLLEHLLERLCARFPKEQVVLATSESEDNRVLIALAERMGVGAFAGDEEDVLGRHLEVARAFGANHLVRVTGDNPLTDLALIEQLTAAHLAEGADYTYVPGDALLMGILSEVISRAALERSHREGEDRHRSELVTLYIKENPGRFRILRAKLDPALYRPHYRLTVDEPRDLELMDTLFRRLYQRGRTLETREAIELLDSEPELLEMNTSVRSSDANMRSVALDGEPLA